jgi:hypothetical protein
MRAALLAVLLLAGAAEAFDVALEPYRQAQKAGALGVVTGRAYADPRRPGGPPTPLAGTVVALVPRSEALLGTLERLRAQARDSLPAFREAAPRMRRAREALERELLEAAAPDLALLTQVASDGGFRFEEVPAGAWVVFGWQAVPAEMSGRRPSAKDRQTYRLPPRLVGYEAVTVWLREITVTGGETASVELTDRNGWFRGVSEERVRDADR